MYFTLKLRDALPLLAALALIAAAFLLPPLEADEPEAAAVFAEGGETLIIDAGHGGADGGSACARRGGWRPWPGSSALKRS